MGAVYYLQVVNYHNPEKKSFDRILKIIEEKEKQGINLLIIIYF